MTRRFVSAICSLFSCVLIFSCAKKTVAENSGDESGEIFESGIPRDALSFSAGDFFTLDYTPCKLEDAAAPTYAAFSPGASAKGGSKTISEGPRKISEYKTKYNEKKISAGGAMKIGDDESGARKTDGAREPLSVVDWGPRGKIPAEIRRPSFYVLFSEPVVALAALGARQTQSPVMKITPSLKGVFRWTGTNLLRFDSEEAADPLVSYTIEISADTASIDGEKIEGERIFSTTAAPLKIAGARIAAQDNVYVDKQNAPPEAARNFSVTFNYAVDAKKIESLSQVTAGETPIHFSVEQERIDSVVYTFEDALAQDTEVVVKIKQPASDEFISTSLHTLRPFTFKYFSTDETHGKYANPVRLVFSHPIDERSVLESISTKPEMALTKENVETFGESLLVFGLPVTFKSKYKIQISESLRDAWGRALSGAKEIEVEVPDAAAFARFTDSGARMLEAQFKPRLIFECQNILDGKYKIQRTQDPFDCYFYDGGKSARENTQDGFVAIDAKKKNERIFHVVDLDPFLDEGKGTVRFDAVVTLPRKPTEWDSATSYQVSNSLSAQVTDLGITARVGVNKIVALVTSLSTGAPIEGAEASAFVLKRRGDSAQTVEDSAMSERFSATTDKDGLAVIEIPESKALSLFQENPYNWSGDVMVEARYGNDRAAFMPDSHWAWRGGVMTEPPRAAYKTYARIFMFSDRGLYKPGETVSFKGIDRDQKLGMFFPYNGDYTVTLKSAHWDDDKIYAEQSGCASSEGGFNGSFALPSDIDPGAYEIIYRRADAQIAGGASGRASINVAYFERLKFQTALEMPKTPVIAGGKIQADLSASYLAGGVLDGARYTSAWFREPCGFAPRGEKIGAYKFGPSDAVENRAKVRDDSGALDSSGRAKIFCDTTGAAIKGAPYRYRAAADITDASNQQISTAAATVVHPASYYIGLADCASASAFPKKGETLAFNYALATPDGALVSEMKDADKSARSLAGEGKKISARLTREVWNVAQQQGVYGRVYSRYEKTDVEEMSFSQDLRASGKITVAAKEPGWHTLRVESEDAAGREVVTERKFFATGAGDVSWRQDDASELRLSPDKAQYNPGESAHILLENSLPKGRYLVTVEREGVFTEEVKTFDGAVQVIDVPIARNFVPVVYVSVSSYSTRNGEPSHKYGEADLDKPKGYYGVARLFVNPLVKSFSLKIDSAKPSYRPGEEAEITLTATKGGKPVAGAELSLMAVDRGVLDIVDYHVPNPIEFFYDLSNFPLRVQGGDSRALLMDPVTYEVKDLAGGDSGGDKIQERKDFNPTAVFEPILKTDKNGKVVCRFTLPDNLTTYRVTAFGASGELLALQESEIAARNPVNVQKILPRRLRERDTCEAGVLLTNLDSKTQRARVSLSIETSGENSAENGVFQGRGGAIVDGAREREISIESGASATVYFDVAAQKAGAVNLVFTIKSDAIDERLVCPLEIERPYIFETVATTGAIEEKDEGAAERVVIPGFADNGKGSLSVTLDATRLGALGGAVKYVFDYPYGCMEQQSSRVLPLIIFEDSIDAFSLESKVSDVRACVRSIFKEWKSAQHKNGAFGYWPESQADDLYVSARVAHVCALAALNGYSNEDICVDMEALCGALSRALEEKNTDAYMRAYICFVLALADRPVSDEALATAEISAAQDIRALCFAALAALRKNRDIPLARRCAENVRSYLRPTARGVDLTLPSTGARSYFSAGSEHLALALQLFVSLDKDDDMATRLLSSLLQKQRGGHWANTAETARVLDAIHTLMERRKISDVDLSAAALLDSREIARADFKGAASKPVTVELPFDGNALSKIPRDEMIPLDISKKGKGALYYTAQLRYALPSESQDSRDEGLGVSMSIYDNATGEEIKAGEGSSVVALESGRTYRAEITLSSTYDREFVAMRAPVPSGAEILDATFVTSPLDSGSASGRARYSKDTDDFYGYYYGGNHWMSNQKIYDNEIQFFWNTFGRGQTTVEFKFRAARRGVFPAPPTCAECMYEPEIFGRSQGALFTVK